MFKLDLEKVEEPEIKLPAFTGSWRKHGIFTKTSTSASLTIIKPLTVWIITTCEKFLERGVPDHFTRLLTNLYLGQDTTVRTRHGTMDWFKTGTGVGQGIYCPLYTLYI